MNSAHRADMEDSGNGTSDFRGLENSVDPLPEHSIGLQVQQLEEFVLAGPESSAGSEQVSLYVCLLFCSYLNKLKRSARTNDTGKYCHYLDLGKWRWDNSSK